MTKLYVLPESVALEFVDQYDPRTGAHWIPLSDGLVLMAADFGHEHNEERFLDHPEVAILPDPVFEGNKTLKVAKGEVGKKMKDIHITALGNKLGLTDNATVVDISKAAKAIHPLVRCKYLR